MTNWETYGHYLIFWEDFWNDFLFVVFSFSLVMSLPLFLDFRQSMEKTTMFLCNLRMYFQEY